MTTRWHDKAVVPHDYEDLPGLVRLARTARTRIVEFDWELTEGELRQLREAVCHWGRGVVGRYKKFDAQVLLAINELLNEPDSAYRFEIPKVRGETSSSVQAYREGSSFFLRGVANFDLIFGYGISGNDPEVQLRLGNTLREKLRTTVEQLGWDLQRLSEPRWVAVKNALYGLPLDYGSSVTPIEPGAVTSEIELSLSGPLSLFAGDESRYLFDFDAVTRSGIYLMTVEIEGVDYVHYVGQTRRSFAERIGEHVEAYAAGEYAILDPAQLAVGQQKVLWQGAQRGSEYCRRVPDFLAQINELAPSIRALLRLLRYHVAPVAKDKSSMLDQLEGGLGRHFQSHESPRVRGVFAIGARHPATIPGANRTRCYLTSDATIVGLPSALLV